MAKPNTDAEGYNSTSYIPPIKNRLTPQELAALDVELKKYMYRKQVHFPVQEEVDILNREKWFIDRGGKNKYGAVIVRDYKSPLYTSEGKCIRPVDCEPIYYEQLSEDLDQWKKWKSRVAYAQGKQFEQLIMGM